MDVRTIASDPKNPVVAIKLTKKMMTKVRIRKSDIEIAILRWNVAISSSK